MDFTSEHCGTFRTNLFKVSDGASGYHYWLGNIPTASADGTFTLCGPAGRKFLLEMLSIRLVCSNSQYVLDFGSCSFFQPEDPIGFNLENPPSYAPTSVTCSPFELVFEGITSNWGNYSARIFEDPACNLITNCCGVPVPDNYYADVYQRMVPTFLHNWRFRNILLNKTPNVTFSYNGVPPITYGPGWYGTRAVNNYLVQLAVLECSQRSTHSILLGNKVLYSLHDTTVIHEPPSAPTPAEIVLCNICDICEISAGQLSINQITGFADFGVQINSQPTGVELCCCRGFPVKKDLRVTVTQTCTASGQTTTSSSSFSTNIDNQFLAISSYALNHWFPPGGGLTMRSFYDKTEGRSRLIFVLEYIAPPFVPRTISKVVDPNSCSPFFVDTTITVPDMASCFGEATYRIVITE